MLKKVEMSKIISSKYRLIQIYIFALLISLVINYFYQYIIHDKYFFQYPSNTNVVLFILICLLIVVMGLIIYKFYKSFKSKKESSKIVIYVVLASFCLLLILNLFQYKLYLISPDNYKVNEEIRQFHVNGEIKKLDILINQYYAEISVTDSVINKLNTDTLRTTFIDRKTIKKSSKYSYNGYLYTQDKLQIYFREHEDDLREPKPPIKINGEPKNYDFELNAISIFINGNEIVVYKDQNTINCLDSIKVNILSIPSHRIINLINVIKQDKIDNINKLNKNKSLIDKRGLPLGVFIFDSLKMVFGGIDDYKPLSWLGRFIEILQMIFTIMFLMPLVGEPYVIIKKYFN
jgi:hypothetical protein